MNEIGIPFGTVVQKNVYVKILQDIHFMVKYQGFGISETVLRQLHDNDITLIQFIYQGKEKAHVYFCGLSQFLKSSKTHIFNDVDKQYFVSIKDMLEIN